MRVLVTRPSAVARRTAAALEARGHTPLIEPLLRLVFAPPPRLFAAPPAGVIVTSANALRAVADHPDLAALRGLPLFAVGARTATAAQALGLTPAAIGDGDAADLISRIRGLAAGTRLLHLAGADRAHDLAALAGAAGLMLDTAIVYRAEPVAALTPKAAAALAAAQVDAVAHYSRRTAEALLTLAAAAGLTHAALRPVHLCLSAQVAEPLRAAGAAEIRVAPRPEEPALLDLIVSA